MGSQQTATTDPTTPHHRTFFGHPWGLANLAGVEMWERFSFYGMQAILVYYLYYSVTDGGLGLPESTATSIVGAYGGLVYLSAILGSWVADRLFGAERTLTGAAVLIMCGHISLAIFPGLGGVGVGLICIALGSGTLKATTSSVLGDMYAPDDERRDGGFSIYYMGVNLGALFGPLLTGLVWGWKGFHWGFGLAAIGMAAGLVVFVIGRGALRGAGEPPVALKKNTEVTLYATGVGAVAVIWGLIQFQDVIEGLLWITFPIMFGYILYEAFKLDKEPRERIFAILFLIALNPLFWGLFEQAGGSINLYTDRFVDRGGVPASLFQSINPIYIILFAPFFAALASRRLPSRRTPK